MFDPRFIILIALTTTACNSLLFEQSDAATGSTTKTADTADTADTAHDTSTTHGTDTGEDGEGSRGDSSSTSGAPGTTQGETSSGETSTTSPPTLCGNHVKDEGEECDDGNQSSEDNCKDDCTLNFCGDGVINIGVERCDDPDRDKCSEKCQQQVIFVTTGTWNGYLGGLKGADQKCENAAISSGHLPLNETHYRAWLSKGDDGNPLTDDSSIHIKDRLPHSDVPYVLSNGEPVAKDWWALTAGNLATAITRTEDNKPVAGSGNGQVVPVWTNSTPSGEASGILDCDYWLKGVGYGGQRGNATAQNSQWTYHSNEDCKVKAHLYCVEINCKVPGNENFCQK